MEIFVVRWVQDAFTQTCPRDRKFQRDKTASYVELQFYSHTFNVEEHQTRQTSTLLVRTMEHYQISPSVDENSRILNTLENNSPYESRDHNKAKTIGRFVVSANLCGYNVAIC